MNLMKKKICLISCNKILIFNKRNRELYSVIRNVIMHNVKSTQMWSEVIEHDPRDRIMHNLQSSNNYPVARNMPS